MFDTKFGARYNVTKPFVLTSTRKDVSAGNCVTTMISLPRKHISCSSQVIAASIAFVRLLHRVRMPWILEHPCDCGGGMYRKSRLFGTAWILSDFFHFLDHRTGNEHYFWLEMWTAEIFTALLASVLGQAGVAVCLESTCSFIQGLSRHAQSFALHVTPFLVCHGSHHGSTSISENTSFAWTEIVNQRGRGVSTGIIGAHLWI